MSAWVVSKAHIDVLVSALAEFKVRHDLGADAKAIGPALWRENVASVAYRYDLATRDDERKGELDGYNADIAAYEPRELLEMKPGPLLRVVDCYEYQSCEHPGWEGSPSAKAMALLTYAIAKRLAGAAYEAAPWGVDTEAELSTVCNPRAVSLSSIMDAVAIGGGTHRLTRKRRAVEPDRLSRR